MIVSRANYISAQSGNPVRIVGLSTALANAHDLANWLGIDRSGLFNFRPSVRPVPLEYHIRGFPGEHYCPRMATMNKPAYAAIQTYSPERPVLVFVSSRRQTRLTAMDLMSYCAADDNPKHWLHMPEEELAILLEQVGRGCDERKKKFFVFFFFGTFFLSLCVSCLCSSSLAFLLTFFFLFFFFFISLSIVHRFLSLSLFLPLFTFPLSFPSTSFSFYLLLSLFSLCRKLFRSVMQT